MPAKGLQPHFENRLASPREGAFLDEDKVGVVALADETPVPDAEPACRRVGRLGNDGFHGKAAVGDVLAQAGERMLRQGQARRRFQIGAGLFLPGVGGVIGGDDVNAAVVHRGKQGFAVAGLLDRWVALDVGALVGVPGGVEIQVVYADLGGDSFAGQVAGGGTGPVRVRW